MCRNGADRNRSGSKVLLCSSSCSHVSLHQIIRLFDNLSTGILIYTYSLLPASQLGGHILLTSCLTALVSRTIYRSYLALPPSSATRHRQPLRRNHVRIFISLAFLGLITAGWFGVSGASLSYRVWAIERGVELPDRSVVANLPEKVNYMA